MLNQLVMFLERRWDGWRLGSLNFVRLGNFRSLKSWLQFWKELLIEIKAGIKLARFPSELMPRDFQWIRGIIGLQRQTHTFCYSKLEGFCSWFYEIHFLASLNKFCSVFKSSGLVIFCRLFFKHFTTSCSALVNPANRVSRLICLNSLSNTFIKTWWFFRILGRRAP